jgi:hydroxymethylglutaryl-CoA lyase
MKIIESPREGMQGFHRLISTDDKVRYIRSLLKVGFNTVETGSIVSAKVIPQMADSLDVLEKLGIEGQSGQIMMLAVNHYGADVISGLPVVTHLSYPFSFCPTFLKLNVNSTVEKSMETVERITELCDKTGKSAVIYISMAFGNPYGDPWSLSMLTDWVGKLVEAGVRTIPLSNVSTEVDATQIAGVYSTLFNYYPDVEFGLHLHTTNNGWYDKVEAAWNAGCRRFDGVINGWGGCPMAGKAMLGNLKTENLIAFAEKKAIALSLDKEALWDVYAKAREVFGKLD